MQHWLQDFESIGENCEFGFVQRALGLEASSLLRWALLDSVSATAVGIRGGFDRVFSFENLCPAGAGTMVRDVTTGVAFHTSMRSELRNGVWRFIAPEAERRRIHREEMQKFLHLRQKFRRDLIAGKQIYVAKRNDGLTEEDARVLAEAIAGWGDGRLLFLTADDTGQRVGTIERVSERIVHGWIDRFAPFERADAVSLPAWESVLRGTIEEFVTTPPTGRWRRPRGRRLAPNPNLLPASLPAAPLAVATPFQTEAAPLAPPSTVAPTEPEYRWHWAPPCPRGPAAARLVSQVGTRSTRRDHLAAVRELFELLPGKQPGGSTGVLSQLFFQDRYYTETYTLEREGGQLAPPRPASNHPPTGYLSAQSVVVAARLRSARSYRHPATAADPEHLAQLRQIFAPRLYARLIGQPADDVGEVWNHYVDHGLPAGIAPTPLFDPATYRRHAVRADLPCLKFGEPPVLHWLRVGRPAGVVPSSVLDMPFYRAGNPDVPGTDADAFYHFLSAGLYENRAPTIWFDPHWYAAANRSVEAARFDEFIASGVHEGRAPSALVDDVMRTLGEGRAFDGQVYGALMEASLKWHGQVSTSALSLLIGLYAPAWQHPSGPLLDDFLSFLGDGVASGRRPGPLFDEAVYRRRAAQAGLPALAPHESPLLHWLKFGYAAKIVPTDRFNEAIYLAKNPDIAQAGLWGFAHFVHHGVHEGRIAVDQPTFRRRDPLTKPSALAGPALQRHWYSMDFPTAETGLGDEIPKAAYERLHALLGSENLSKIFAHAQAIEPDVGELATIDDFLLLPYYDAMALRHAEACRRLPRTQYDTVICVPWIRVGGADLVAGLLAKAVLQIRPEESVLVLRVDNPHFECANWLPRNADVVDVSDLVAGIGHGHQLNVLRCLFRGVGPRRVINVNSRICWSLFRTYGANLASTMHLYAYMFCWDQTPSGLRAGYPAEFYADTAEHVTAFLTDTRYLRDELATMYRLPAQTADRIVPLFTPAQTAIWTPSAARVVQDRADPASRRLVLWAGRLDRQKRFDLVQDIARLIPDVEFRCWGAALLDAPPDLGTLPANVTMQGNFDSFDDLPLQQAGAWLFTALWEGMPTTIIELATRGVPLVASAVGGVPELIRPETGWPVNGDASAEAYASSLREALSNPAEATRRAEALQRLVADTYNETVYHSALDRIFRDENGARP